MHSESPLVFASYHIGGCAHCSVNEIETIEQVCQGYGIEVEDILQSLNGLLEENEENHEE
jgi:hypothetical protein